jgi:hypothetical protein
MIFKNHRDEDIEVNPTNFKQIMRDGALENALTKVELLDGTIVWLKAPDEQVIKAVNEPLHQD